MLKQAIRVLWALIATAVVVSGCMAYTMRNIGWIIAGAAISLGLALCVGALTAVNEAVTYSPSKAFRATWKAGSK